MRHGLRELRGRARGRRHRDLRARDGGAHALIGGAAAGLRRLVRRLAPHRRHDGGTPRPGGGAWLDVAAASRLDPGRELMADRAAEFGERFGLTPDEAVALYRAYSVERTRRAPRFDASSLDALLASYVHPARLEADLSRLMMHYTRFGQAQALVDWLVATHPGDRSALRVVDYGCGAADFGLAFALAGCRVTLVDIAGGKIEFASWRLARRGLAHDVLPIDRGREYPDFAGAHLVVAGDLLEHLRDPCAGIEAVHRGLRAGGHFWFPDFPFKEKSVGGQHLAEAAEARQRAADLVRARFVPAGAIKHLMRRA